MRIRLIKILAPVCHGTRSVPATLVGLFLALSAASVSAQQIAIGTPFNSVQDDFFERIGVGFGFSLGSGPNQVVFSQGGFNSAIPPFGGFDPNTEARTGFALLKGNNRFFFDFAASQGSTRSMINQTPSVVIHNGMQGTVSDTSLTPFVTGIIPVVGDAFVLPYNPPRIATPTLLQERLHRYQEEQRQGASVRRAAASARPTGAENLPKDEKASLKLGGGSSADRGDLSVAEIKKQQAAEEAAKNQEVQGYIERGRGAEQAGKTNVAKIYYRQALARASGSLRGELQVKIDALGN